MNFFKIFSLIWFQLLIINVLGSSFYSITAPGLLKSNRKYTVAVTLDHTEDQCTIRISIEGLSYNASYDVQLQAYETKLVDFYPPKLMEGKYKLIAEGIEGLAFRNETELLTELDTGPNVYIQTDRTSYKPGDLIQFRVVVLNEHTRPLNISEPIRVDILDYQGNRVKQFKDITLVKGVFTGKFQLSQRPVLGTWAIRVRITGKYDFNSIKNFKVAKYTLPKFSVHIETAKDIVLEDESVKALIYGKYTFGRYVEGTVNIQLWEVTTRSRTLLQEDDLAIETLIPVNINLDNSQNYTRDLYKLEIQVRITDKFSGTVRSNSEIINVHKMRYHIEIPYTEVELYNGIPYLLKAYVSYRTGAPVLDRQTPVVLKHGNKTYETFLEGEGVATFRFQYDSDDFFTVLFKDSKQIMPNYFKISEAMFYESEKFCKLKLLKEKPRFGVPIEIEVSSKDNIPYLAYVLVGHGNIIRMQHILMAPLKKSYILRLMPSIDMVPDANLYVYYIDDGKLRSNEIKISLPNEFENKISIVAPKEVAPGQTVILELKAQPNSYVCVLAVDLSVYLYNPNYDLYKEKILMDLQKDKSYVELKENLLWPGISSGLIILTNAAMPYLSNASLVDPYNTRSITINYRTNFPETWIFQNFDINSTTTQLTFKVPDTITTWRITAFSSNDIMGFGIVDKPTDIISTRSFFITTTLPYSVKLGEIFDVPVTIFNYQQTTVKSEITMYNDKNEFKFIEESSAKDALEQHKTVEVKSDSGESVTFKIKPIKIGLITLRLTAITDLDRDAIIKELKVEAAGVIKSFNDARYIKAVENKTITTKFLLDFPTNIIKDSEYVKLEVGGSYLKPSLENFHRLVKKPTGCGEQNMVNFAPSILILQLLKATGKYSDSNSLVIKLKSFIEIGYQQQLAYRHYSGSFSVFGEGYGVQQSTWLTAYVLRFFLKASQYTAIDNRIIETGLEYLSRQQLQDGSFPYTGHLFMPAQKNVYGVTAFVLLTFLESKQHSRKYSTQINNALRFLNTHVDNIEDLYSLSIIAAALKAAKNQEATKVLEKLNHVSKSDSNGNKWWSSSRERNENAVEITSYILLALLETPGDYTNIAKWLIEQRNELGGFASTHDTVVGLQALIKYYEQLQASNDTQVMLKYTAKNKMGGIVHKGGFEVMADNFEDLQIKELPKTTSEVVFEINGSGYVLVQLNHQYNILNESLGYKQSVMQSSQIESAPPEALAVASKFQYFLIESQARLLSSFLLDLEVCFMYQSLAEHSLHKTNMVLLEANLPSGFRSNAANSQTLKDNYLIERIETKNDDTTIVLYFDGLMVNSSECINIDGEKVADVFERQPAAIKIYDYYNESLSETIFYTVDMNK